MSDEISYAEGLAGPARFLPRSAGINRGLRLVRVVMDLGGRAGGSAQNQVVSLASGLSVRIVRAPGTPQVAPAVLWLHGGGRVMGTAAQDDKYLAMLSERTGTVAVAVDYRLAPEHPHPVPIEDCYQALTWLAQQPWVDPARIVVAGASAGGGLAASLAQLAHDRGEVRPVLQALVYPMLDDRTGPESDIPGQRLWSGANNRHAWRLYLNGHDPDDQTTSPVAARRAELSGLPPAWIGVGTLDLFLGESRAYAERLQAAGVAVDLVEVDGAYHAFDQLAASSPTAKRFTGSLAEAIRMAVDC